MISKPYLWQLQGGTPILTGIDPESTYIYLLEEASDRTGETWQIYMQDCKDRGLQLETSINDSGSGLLSGIPKVYVDCHIIVSEKNRNRVSKYQDANHKPATQKQNKMTKRIKIT